MLVQRIRCALILSFAVFATNLASGQIHVDPTSPNNGPGFNWVTAHHSLQMAINQANGFAGVVHIIVAEGSTYYPDSNATWQGTAPSNQTFLLKSSSTPDQVLLHGGFKGWNNGSPGTSNWDSPDGSYENTILSGKLGNFHYFHVLVADTATGNLNAKATVDGFKVTGGQAAGQAGAVHEDGAGMYCNADAMVRLENITWVSNVAAKRGGAIFNTTTGTTNLLEIKQCTFDNNQAARGAGLFAFASPKVLLVNVDFHSNGSPQAGASGLPPVTTRGGAIFADDETVLDCSNGLFDSNYSNRGGAVYTRPACGSDPASFRQYWRNCTFAGNTSSSASSYGAGFHHEARSSGPCADATLGIFNCIFWNQVNGLDIFLEANNTCTVNDTCWDGDTSSLPSGFTVDAASFTADPLFIDAPNHNYRLDNTDPLSPCIDVGDNGEVGKDFLDLDRDNDFDEDLPRDLDLARRIQNNTVDLGPYED